MLINRMFKMSTFTFDARRNSFAKAKNRVENCWADRFR